MNLRLDVRQDWDWSDRYLREVTEILSLHAPLMFRVVPATVKQDTRQATDMVVSFEGLRMIAVRIRRQVYGYRDLTLRTVRWNGVTTELEKIMAGYGDYYLYGWTRDDLIVEWMLVDLRRLRESGLLIRHWDVIHNQDQQTGFIAIPYSALKACGCVMAAHVEGKDR
ncbi:MAG: hypothetical protein K8L99_04845 [Anaerolineae bacterium]|nr:hypothetical protein [Anaerolineae bacterium]